MKKASIITVVLILIMLGCKIKITDKNVEQLTTTSTDIFDQLKKDSSYTTVSKMNHSDKSFGYYIRHEVPDNWDEVVSEFKSIQGYSIGLNEKGELISFIAKNNDFEFILTKTDSGYKVESSRANDYLYDKR
jgi:hypothetical protein